MSSPVSQPTRTTIPIAIETRPNDLVGSLRIGPNKAEAIGLLGCNMSRAHPWNRAADPRSGPSTSSPAQRSINHPTRGEGPGAEGDRPFASKEIMARFPSAR